MHDMMSLGSWQKLNCHILQFELRSAEVSQEPRSPQLCGVPHP